MQGGMEKRRGDQILDYDPNAARKKSGPFEDCHSLNQAVRLRWISGRIASSESGRLRVTNAAEIVYWLMITLADSYWQRFRTTCPLPSNREVKGGG